MGHFGIWAVMTGVLNAVIGTPAIERVSITLIQDGSRYGPDGGSFAISMRGATLFYIDYTPSNQRIVLQLAPVLGQSFFKRISIEDGVANTFQTFTSASATYQEIGGIVSEWVWTTPTLWGAGDVGEVKRIIFNF